MHIGERILDDPQSYARPPGSPTMRGTRNVTTTEFAGRSARQDALRDAAFILRKPAPHTLQRGIHPLYFVYCQIITFYFRLKSRFFLP